MQLYAILFTLTVFSYTKAEKCNPSNVGGIINRCLARHQGSEIDILDLLAAKKSRSDNAKCFRACLMIECGNMDPLGKLSPDIPQIAGEILGAGDFVRSSAIEKVAFDCLVASETSGDVCHIAEDFMQCMVNNCKHQCRLNIPSLKI